MATTTPSTKWNNFAFLDYRSPDRVSDSSGSPTPFQTPVTGVSQSAQHISKNVVRRPNFNRPSQIKSGSLLTTDAPNRREQKMRFSFIVSTDEGPSNTSRDSKRSHRPSIVDVDSLCHEEMAPAVAFSPSAVNNDSQAGISTEMLSKSVMSSTGFGLRKARRSSQLSNSEYFDATEEQSFLKVGRLEKVQEDQDANNGMAGDNGEEDADKKEDVECDDSIDSSTDTDTYVESDGLEEEDTDEKDEESGSDQNLGKNMHLRRHYTSLPCTRATRSDTRRLKAAALSLIQYNESEEIYAALADRIQRMIAFEDELAARENRAEASVARLARGLRTWLEEIQDGRMMTGETPRFVRHEIEWARWLEEAARTGVLHLKRKGCRCGKEWKKRH